MSVKIGLSNEKRSAVLFKKEGGTNGNFTIYAPQKYCFCDQMKVHDYFKTQTQKYADWNPDFFFLCFADRASQYNLSNWPT